METASIRQLPDRLYRDSVSLKSRKFTPLLVGRVDSREPRGALPWTARTMWNAVPTERTSPPAHFRGPLLPRAQLIEKTQPRAAKRWPAGVSDPLLLNS